MDQAVLNLRRLILAGEHYRQMVAEAIGVGTTESQTLCYLAVHGSTGQSQLARGLGLTSSALTSLVDRLDRQGLAIRVRHPHDRRCAIVQLTERGSAVVAESHKWLAVTLDHVDPDQLDSVSASLDVMADNLGGWTADDHVDELAKATRKPLDCTPCHGGDSSFRTCPVVDNET